MRAASLDEGLQIIVALALLSSFAGLISFYLLDSVGLGGVLLVP